VQNIRMLHERIPINIFIFDYRGYGQSTGDVSEPGTYEDGRAAVELLRQRYAVKPAELVLFGRSLGAAVAAQIAREIETRLLVLESPFVSVGEMARVMFPLLPLGRFLSVQYNTLEKIRHVRSPLLVLHGQRDEIVPFSQGRRVFEGANEPKRFYAIPDAGHNDTYVAGGEAYFVALADAVRWSAQVKRENASSDASR
jgi:fermentation-respiration switch protein FrsA (DUF1100 family)